jgi:hypothetical protein
MFHLVAVYLVIFLVGMSDLLSWGISDFTVAHSSRLTKLENPDFLWYLKCSSNSRAIFQLKMQLESGLP